MSTPIPWRTAVACLLSVVALQTTALPAELRLLKERADELLLELTLSAPHPVQRETDGQRWDVLHLDGFVNQDQPGHPAVPFIARLVAAPPGTRPLVEVVEAEWEKLEGIDLLPASDKTEPPSHLPDPGVYAQDRALPAEPVVIAYAGQLRGTAAYALHFYPFSYNPARRRLHVCTRMRVRVRFVGQHRLPALRPAPTPHNAALFSAFLNPAQAASWAVRSPAPKVAVDGWQNPALPWIRVQVEQDGLYRIDADWLGRHTNPASIDPRTFQLFYLGEEQPLLVRNQEAGRFTIGDELIFAGSLRRDDRDFGSLYGPRNTYWLTWGGEDGKRFSERSGAPMHGYPQQRSFRTTGHFEVDAVYDPLPDAPDMDRDHWFWFRIDGRHPTQPGSGTFPGILRAPDLSQEYTARLRVALHGATNLPHHTAIRLNTHHLVADTIWGARREGRIALEIEAEIPSTALRDNINRVTVQVFADQEKFDYVYMNWFQIEYLRQYQAEDGHLEFEQPPSTGHRLEIAGLRDSQGELLDVVRGIRFTDLAFDSTAGQVRVVLEDRSAQQTRYVIADRQALKSPRGESVALSTWRRGDHRADYLIIAHPRLLAAAHRLAAHRRTTGLEVAVVSTQELYDEFSFGRTQQQAIADFIHYAYHHWEHQPAYVLLLGDDTYDYRNILSSRTPTFVPAPYYMSRGRGIAPSDFLYSLVDGDDLLPDLAIGRLAAENERVAEQVVDKVVQYDLAPEPGDWRSRVIYLANYHPQNLFTAPSDLLAERYTQPWGLNSLKIYNPDETSIPNATGRALLEALNQGALLLNFNGHGSLGTMQFVFSLNMPDWDYLSQVRNHGRLPLVLALSCLNGLFVHPLFDGLAETFVNHPEGGAIAYISASAQSYPSQNNLLSEFLYDNFFNRGNLPFGSALNAAKSQVLAAYPSWTEVAFTMHLFGDPAQQLALPYLPDYAAQGLRLVDEQVFGHSTVEVNAELRNLGRYTADSLQVAVLGYSSDAAWPDTLHLAGYPPFARTFDLSFPWEVGAHRGAYRLELVVDPENRLSELDKENNRLALELEILEPRRAIPLFPAAGAVLTRAEELQLEALTPLSGGRFVGEFALARDPDFAPESTFFSPLIPAVGGVSAYPLELLETGLPLSPGPYFWQVRLHTQDAAGPWSETRTFSFSPHGQPAVWRQQDRQFTPLVTKRLWLEADGLTLSPESLPFRPSSATREDAFTVRGLDGAGVLATDGAYLYAKRWYNDDSTIYPGIDFFTRVGTGYNQLQRAGNYGLLADSTTASISATYHSDGYLYNESGRAFELERLSVATGKLDTVAVPAGLLEWQTGHLIDGHSLITSDGRLIYNVSMSAGQGRRTAWGVRVFDPASDWALVREFTSPPTAETGFTFQWTDGILADGRRLYFIEYGGGRRIRMVDAFDGRLLDEWTSDQETSRIISGQYDWVNNKVWLGDLLGSTIYRYTGLGQVDSAAVRSAPIGPAARWEKLWLDGETTGQGRLTIDLLVQQGAQWMPHPDFIGLSPEEVVDLSRLDALLYPHICLQARLEGGYPHARLRSWSVDFVPRPRVLMAQAEGRKTEAGLQVALQVRNLSSFAVDGARVTLERSDRSRPLTERSLARLARGETRQVTMDSLEVPPTGVRLFARVHTALPAAYPADGSQEVLLLFGGHAPLVFELWPDGVPLLNGDPLRPEQGVVVAAPETPGADLELTLNGVAATPDSVLETGPDSGPRLLYRPQQLLPGEHRIQARLFSDGEERGSGERVFRLSTRLAIAHPLVYPQPAREQAAFTYVLSHDAEVLVDIFTLSGRLARSLGPTPQTAGFQQLIWDGRDADGRRLANGVYLYRLRARRAAEEAVHRGPLVVVR